MVNEEPHKSTIRTTEKRKRETANQIRTLSGFRENVFDVEAWDTNPTIAS